jgi:23S rRNA (adenine2503-C2)-methyltransferase
MEKINIRDLTKDELIGLVAEFSEKPYRAEQIFSWLYERGVSISEMTDLKLELRERLKERFSDSLPEVKDFQAAVDGTVKFTSVLSDGELIESVIISEEDRATLCVSTQTGCGEGCVFCMTGRSGPGRNLLPFEMASQVLSANEFLSNDGEVTNVVLMGMGEPLANYDNVLKFIRVAVDPKGFAFAPRRVTVSTVGLVEGIEKLGRDTNVSLAVSLNATDDAVRTRLMPINRKYPINELMSVLRRYPMKNRRYITIEYVLIKGINDSLDDANRLVELLKGIKSKVNLIAFNPHSGSDFQAPTDETIQAFKDVLYEARIITILRQSKGADIGAACGQLAGRGKK